MGGLAGVLGHAATGFEQAHQEDLQRQFATELGSRQAALDMFKTIAFDPNQPDELRNAGLQGIITTAQTPYGKFKLGKATEPLQQLMAQHNAARFAAQHAPPQPGPITPGAPLQIPPPPAPGAATATIPMQARPLPQGVAGPPQQVPGVPQITAPPRPLAMAGQAVQGPPVPAQPPSPFMAGVPQIAQNAATLASAQSGGALSGQMQARSQMADQILNDPQYSQMISQDPMMQQMLMSMKMGVQLPFSYYGMMNRNVGTGGGYARDLRAQGLDVPGNIKDDQWVNVRELAGGRRTFEPGAAPGEKAVGAGELGDIGKQAAVRSQAELPVWLKKNQIQFGQRQALLNQAFQLGVDRGYLGDANKAFVDSVKDYGTANKTMQSMDEAFKAVQQNPNNQQAQVALLMAHIGMTLGVVKGARVGKAQIEEAEQSRTMFAGAASKLNFDKDGNLDWSDPIRKGVTLTPDQMRQMVELGHQRMQILHDNIGTMHDQLNPGQMEVQPLGTSFGKKNAGKTRVGTPPKPSSGNKVLSQAAIAQAAKDHGVSVDEAMRQAKAQGYTVQ